jgi:Guanine nucleotide exchange factor synembryn
MDSVVDLDQLRFILVAEAGEDPGHCQTTDVAIAPTAGNSLRLLSQWNARAEATCRGQLLHQTEREAGALKEEEDDMVTGKPPHSQVSHLLRSTLLLVLDGKSFESAVNEPNALPTPEYTLQHWNEHSDHPPLHRDDLIEVLRACQNWFRIYLRSNAPSASTRQLEDSGDVVLGSWQTNAMLKLYLLVLEDIQLEQGCLNGARYASNLLFYASFSMTAVGKHKQRYTLFILESQLMDRLLRLLLRQREFSVPLSLSVVRNVHNSVATLSHLEASETTEAASFDTSECDGEVVQWAKSTALEKITYKHAFRELTLFLLKGPGDDANRFPGSSPHDQRAELVLEILRCSYVLRLGSDLVNHEHWKELIGVLLNLDTHNGLCFECQLAAVALLTDADADVVNDIICSSSSVPALVQILDAQVSTVLHENLVDNRAAAALSPILILLYKCCSSGQTIQAAVRNSLLPPSDAFSQAIADEEKRTGHKRAVNLSPLDAPVGELRWKLIQLLTSHESIVKRLTGELLFVLCHAQPHDFIRRVGIGNAIPLLGSKGLVQFGSKDGGM